MSLILSLIKIALLYFLAVYDVALAIVVAIAIGYLTAGVEFLRTYDTTSRAPIPKIVTDYQSGTRVIGPVLLWVTAPLKKVKTMGLKRIYLHLANASYVLIPPFVFALSKSDSLLFKLLISAGIAIALYISNIFMPIVLFVIEGIIFGSEKIHMEEYGAVEDHSSATKRTEGYDALIDILNEAAKKHSGEGMEFVKGILEGVLGSNKQEISRIISKGTDPRVWVYSAIGNTCGDYLESGEYHIYRGVLNDMDIGPSLLNLYDLSLDELVAINAIEKEYAENQKQALRNNIASVG